MVRLGPDQFLVSDCPAYGQSAPSLKRWSVSDLQAPGRGRCPGVAHGQVASALSGGRARVEGLDRRAVQRALWEDRTLVKTWAMRGTLHLLPANDLPMWHAALSTSRRYLKPALWQKYFGITIEQLDRLTEAVGSALDAGC
jgi:hypothetical protein